MSSPSEIPRFCRSILQELLQRLEEPSRFIQVLSGPRQAGKSTLARQAMARCRFPSHYASADEPGLRDTSWIAGEWDSAREIAKRTGKVLLVLDEIQKIPGWSETVKRLWDEDTMAGHRPHVVLLGSAKLLVQHGLTESLAGRFEVIPVPHWSFEEMSLAFGWSLDQYLFYGGYPGVVGLVQNHQRWSRYILDSLVETTVSRDILLLTRVDKPALLRQLFRLSCEYSGQILSYQKMLGQLQDAGNTTTLAHYLDLLGTAGMVMGLQKYSGSRVRQHGSIPKLLVLNTALMTSQSGLTFPEALANREFWGRLVESAVGGHLVNSAVGTQIEVTYWRERNREVDYILSGAQNVLAMEVKSGRRRTSRSGLSAFGGAHPRSRPLIVGGDGLDIGECLRIPAGQMLARSQPGRAGISPRQA